MVKEKKNYSEITSSVFELGALHERAEHKHLTKKHPSVWLSGSSESPSTTHVNASAGA